MEKLIVSKKKVFKINIINVQKTSKNETHKN